MHQLNKTRQTLTDNDMKKHILILSLIFKTAIVLCQTIEVQSETYLYSSPFYSWEKHGFDSPQKVLPLNKYDKVIAIGFYLIGDNNNYAGDIKVKFNEKEGWVSSINFNSESLKAIPLINSEIDLLKPKPFEDPKVLEQPKTKETEKKVELPKPQAEKKILTKQNISDLKLNAKPANGDLYSIFDLDVFSYYNLHDYDSDLKKVIFKKTEEYQSKLTELKLFKSEMMKTTYYAKLVEAFNNVNYDIKRKGFEIEIGSDFAAYPQNAKPPKAIYIQGEELSIILKALPTKQVRDPYMGGKQEMLFVSMTEESGLEIENNKQSIEAYFFFTPTGKEKNTSSYSIVSPPSIQTISDYYLKSDKVRVVVANNSTGIIYFDKTYSYQPPTPIK